SIAADQDQSRPENPLQPISDNAATVHPELVLEGFHSFNIVRFGDEFHGILQIEGEFVQEKLLSKKYSCSFSGYSLLEIQNAIIASIAPGQDQSRLTKKSNNSLIQ
ncbi:MAG: hypothetical protein M0Q44_20480, partial [Methylobacter sp.]|nr:hypothetical protein [Methylobacter sp.]